MQLSAAILLAGSGSLLLLLAWLGGQMIVNPQQLVWLNQWVPGLVPNPLGGWGVPQTMPQIQVALQKTGRSAGDLIRLGPNRSWMDQRPVVDWLLPIYQRQPNCQTSCDAIVELRVYQAPDRHATPTYHLVSQLAIAGLEESFVIAPMVDAQTANQGSSRALPLTQLKRFTGQVPQPGIWLSLQSRLQRSMGDTLYGQILYYNPTRLHLSSKLTWSSPAQQEPRWVNVTGSPAPELVVNRTTGLDPQFTVYQVTPLKFVDSPVQLEPISLAPNGLTQPRYQTALMLARSGLWMPSLQWLQALKAQGTAWSSIAQAQLDVIAYHARITQQQAKQSWASPSQQILAHLINGNWEAGLGVFESSVAASQETVELLRADRGQLADRIKVGLRAAPRRSSIKFWGVLLQTAQRNQKMALDWLRKQAQPTSEELDQATRLSQRLDPNFTEQDARRQLGQFWGVAQFMPTRPAPDWQTLPGASVAQKGYRLRLSQVKLGRSWQALSAVGWTSSLPIAQMAGQLGLHQDATVELVTWSEAGVPQTRSAQVKAGRWHDGQLELWIEAADELPTTNQPWFVTTPVAFDWMNPTPSTLGDWVSAQPTWQKTALPRLVNEVQQGWHKPRLKVALPSSRWETLDSLGWGQWFVQTVNLTGSPQPEVMITVDPKTLESIAPDLKPWMQRPRTLIFQADGRLIYSELSQERDQQYRAMIDLGQGKLALLSQQADRYQIQQWNPKTKEFQALR